MTREIVQMTSAFCTAHLTPAYHDLCHDLAVTLREEHPSLLTSGRAKSWAAAVVYTIARVNYLFDPSQTPHMSATELCQKLEVSQATASSKSTQIMRVVDGMTMEPDWDLADLFPTDLSTAVSALLDGPLDGEALRRAPGRARGSTRRGSASEATFRVVGGPGRFSEPRANQQEPAFVGLWHIVEMSEWDDSYVNEETQAYIEIDPNGLGTFQFGLVTGHLGGKTVEYHDFTRFEFTWEGVDEHHDVFGSGWIQEQQGRRFHGEIRFHMGDDSTFVAHMQTSSQDQDGMVSPMEPSARGGVRSVYQIKVTLRGIRPPIWRRVLVHSDITLDRLHEILQWAMGWHNSHLHQFVAHGVAYGTPDPDFDDIDVRDEKRMRLDQAIVDPGAKIIYEYDFGDDWQHDVLLEKILPPDEDTDYPVCVKGRRACPPEDCGGPWGYAELLETLQDPTHPEYEDLLQWAGRKIDPDAFDVEETNDERDDTMRLLAEDRDWVGY